MPGSEPQRPRQNTKSPASHFRKPAAAAGFSALAASARYEAGRAVIGGVPRRCVPKGDRPARVPGFAAMPATRTARVARSMTSGRLCASSQLGVRTSTVRTLVAERQPRLASTIPDRAAASPRSSAGSMARHAPLTSVPSARDQFPLPSHHRARAYQEPQSTRMQAPPANGAAKRRLHGRLLQACSSTFRCTMICS